MISNSNYDKVFEFCVNYINEEGCFPSRTIIGEALNIGHHSVDNNIVKMKQRDILYEYDYEGKKVFCIRGLEDKITGVKANKRTMKHEKMQKELLDYYLNYFNEFGFYPLQKEAAEFLNTNSKNISVLTKELVESGNLIDYEEKQKPKEVKTKVKAISIDEKVKAVIYEYVSIFRVIPDNDTISILVGVDIARIVTIVSKLILNGEIEMKLNDCEKGIIVKQIEELKAKALKCFERLEA